MHKLTIALLAGVLSTGLFAQTTSGSSSTSGSVSGSTSSNTNNNAAISANANTNTNTNTNTNNQNVNVYGPGSNKLAKQHAASGTGGTAVSMMPKKPAKTASAAHSDTRTMGAGKACPPGLAKKHNHCMPPGQAKR